MGRIVWRPASEVAIVGQAPSRTSDPSRPLEGQPMQRTLRSLLGVGPLAWSRITKLNVLERWPGKNGKGDAFPPAEARRRALELRPALLGKTVLLLGGTTASAFGVSAPVLRWVDCDGFHSVIVPHPSGVNRWWNDPANRRAARAFLGRVVR